jgi:hypothetical protein
MYVSLFHSTEELFTKDTDLRYHVFFSSITELALDGKTPFLPWLSTLTIYPHPNFSKTSEKTFLSPASKQEMSARHVFECEV